MEDLRLEGVRKSVGDFVLEAEFRIASGERAGLVGRSGSGKTTLLRVIAGLESLDGPGDRGRIWTGQRELTGLPPQVREVGMVFQDQALFPSMSVMENAAFGLRMRGFSKASREAEVLPWLQKVGLAGKAGSPIGWLSGGEAQRVAFVRALVFKPRVILLDEPFSALDAELRSVLRTELLELHRLWPVPMILVSHDPEDLKAIATTRLRVFEVNGNENQGNLPTVRRIQVE